MKRICFLWIHIFLLVMIIAGCKSPAVVSETVDADKVEESIFAAQQDTVKVQTYTEETLSLDSEVEEIDVFYTVQIGAYEQPLSAEQINRKAQQRYALDISSNFDASDELYKITIGKFSNYEQARAFRDRIMHEFPADYYDAWVVKISNRQRRTIQ